MKPRTHPKPGFYGGLDDVELPTTVSVHLDLRITQGDPDIAHDRAIETIVAALREYGGEGQAVLDAMI